MTARMEILARVPAGIWYNIGELDHFLGRSGKKRSQRVLRRTIAGMISGGRASSRVALDDSEVLYLILESDHA